MFSFSFFWCIHAFGFLLLVYNRYTFQCTFLDDDDDDDNNNSNKIWVHTYKDLHCHYLVFYGFFFLYFSNLSSIHAL